MMRLSLACSLTGLAAIYAATMQVRPAMTSIGSLDNQFVGLKVTVSGEVIDFHEHEDGHLFLKLRDDSCGVVSVPIFARVRSELGEPVELLDVVQVTGEVRLYRGELEVVPEGASDLRVVHTAPTKLSGLSEENIGAPVKVQGTIVKREIVGSGSLILTLQEGGSQLSVFVPAWIVEDGMPALHIGYVVRVDGELQLYNDELELRLGGASHLQVIEGS